MRQSKFTEEQIVALLREAEKGEQTIEVLTKAKGISEQTFYRWRKKYAGVDAKDLKRMKELEKEGSVRNFVCKQFSLNDFHPFKRPVRRRLPGTG